MSSNNVNGATPHPSNTAPGQPQVRHIPIYVEGRDEPLLNTSSQGNKSNSFGQNHHATNMNQQHLPHHHQHQTHRSSPDPTGLPSSASSHGSIFDRVKSFPVRSGLQSDLLHNRPGFSAQRTQSPARATTIPVNTSASQATQPAPQQQPSAMGGGPAATATDASIVKIQNIQRDVLALMDQVEQFQGSSKKDKQYLYLDEMLTQNLLKLDNIETDGQENIKQARREAIKCINICIAALERKTESAAVAAAATGTQ